MPLITENQKVLLKKDNCYKIVVVNDKKVDLDRTKFSLNGLIGCPFGSSFTVENGNLMKIVDKSKMNDYEKLKVENLLGDEKLDNSDINLNRDNRNMKLDSKSQLMSASEISDLKRSGESGDSILSKLIENSTSFALKTTFAQEKYLKKKKKRYIPVISVHRITTRMLCELYGARSKQRILNLRIDTLAQLLAYCNVQHGSRVLLVETCAGLLIGSLVERGANVINFYHGSAPLLPDCYSEWRELDGRVYNLPLGQMVPLARRGGFVGHFAAAVATDNRADQTPAPGPAAAGSTLIPIPTRASDSPQPRSENGAAAGEPSSKRQKLSMATVAARRDERDRRREEARDYLLAAQCDSLVIAIKFHPVELTLQALEFLAAGKPFVVYSQFLQPLLELYDALRKRTNSCSLRITESWLRTYQVLPERTHPEMAMSGTGGYILSGIKLSSEDFVGK